MSVERRNRRDNRGITHDTTDLRNAERLVEMHGGELRYVHAWKKWLVWSGAQWLVDDTGGALRLAADTARVMVAESLCALNAAQKAYAAAEGAGDDRAKGSSAGSVAAEQRRFRWAVKTQNAAKLHAMLDVACADRRIATRHDDLDSHPWLLNVKNGTIDLRTGDLRSHDPADLITKLAPVAFDARATCPTWDSFLERSMAGNAELIAFLRRIVGYSLTGETREHVLAFLFGRGANGKSTFLTLLHMMLGDYATPAPRGLLFQSRSERHPTELACLHGARFVTCSEIEEGKAFDEALVKDLTGGDPIECRRMREDFWHFAPSHKLFIAGNHKPIVKGDDEGIWRRMRIVPWTVTIPLAERDKTLLDKLRAELSGILSWAVRGCIEWQREGLGEPPEVMQATDDYRDESDAMGEFCRLHVVFEADASIARKTLRIAYEEYAEENGITPIGARRFAGKLRANGVTDTSVRLPTGKVADGWRGVRLLTDAERAAAATWSGRRAEGTCSDRIPVSEDREDTPGDVNPDCGPTSPYLPSEDDGRQYDFADLLGAE